LIKEESISELLRFTIRHILNQLHNNLIYPILKEEQEQEQQQNKAQNNQQQLVNPVILPSTTTAVAASHQHQLPNNISHRNSLVGQKMTPWKLSSLLSSQTNHHNTF
jgi:hypothetical protein